MLWILFIFNLKDTKLHEKIIISLISVLIMLSTLLIKQHVVIDLISGDIIAIVVFFVIKYENKLTIKVKELLNI